MESKKQNKERKKKIWSEESRGKMGIKMQTS